MNFQLFYAEILTFVVFVYIKRCELFELDQRCLKWFLSESKVVPLGGNRYDLLFYNAPAATRAQNRAKVLQGRAKSERFGLAR